MSTTPQPDSGSGAKFSDLYTVDDKILGTGTFNAVRKATHMNGPTEYAVKQYNKKQLTPDDFIALKKKVNMLRSLNHENITNILDVFDEEDYFSVVQELMAGGELFDIINEKEYFNEKEARDIFKTILSALQYIHGEGIIHRNLKPMNLFVRTKDKESDIIVASFGLAIKPEGKVQELIGTPEYCAPEIMNGIPYDSKVDMWASGVILYVLLAGYIPFHQEDEKERNAAIKDADFEFDEEYWDEISDEAKDLVSQLIIVDPDKRLSASEALEHPWLKAADASVSLNNLRTKKP